MNFFQQSKTILTRATSGKSMMVIWIFGAAMLMVLANPNIVHDSGIDTKSTIKNLATSPVAQQMVEDLAKKAPVEPAHEKEADIISASPQDTVPVAKGDSVVIDKIAVQVPIVTATTTINSKLHALLDLGVVMYPTSAGIGKVGQTVILGHSAPANWPKIKHDTAFSRLNELVAGDLIQIEFQGRTYKYQVTRSQIIPKGSDLMGETPGASWLVLVTCWPPGRDRERLAIEARLLPE